MIILSLVRSLAIAQAMYGIYRTNFYLSFSAELGSSTPALKNKFSGFFRPTSF